MSHQKKWTKEDVQTLKNLRKKKVEMTYIAKVLGRTPAACYSKAWQLIHPDYTRKPKQPTPNYPAVIRTLEQELTHAKNVAINVGEKWAKCKIELTECEVELKECKMELQEYKAELKHAQECMQAIHLNMNQFYNYTKS